MSAWHVDKNTPREYREEYAAMSYYVLASFSQCAKPNEIYVKCLNCIGVRGNKKASEALKKFLKAFLKR
jgi:hypothetical protein